VLSAEDFDRGGSRNVVADPVRLENGRILCARPRGKHIFYIPGGKREGAETDLQTLLLFDDLRAAGELG
jgi:hypothetical protein